MVWKLGWLTEFLIYDIYAVLTAFSLLLFAKQHTPQQLHLNNKKRAFLSEEIEESHLGRTEPSSVLLNSRVKPHLFWHAESGSQLFCSKKRENDRKRSMWNKRHGVPSPEGPGDDNHVDILLEKKTMFQKRCLCGKKTERRIPWSN